MNGSITVFSQIISRLDRSKLNRLVKMDRPISIAQATAIDIHVVLSIYQEPIGRRQAFVLPLWPLAKSFGHPESPVKVFH